MNYNIGVKLKNLRKSGKLTLKQVATATGFSLALISQIENGKISPPIPTLARLARYYRVEIGFFFVEEDERHCVK